ncbi:MAG: hypothetical protein HOH33_11835 [Verrucomicrobia bacterium]|nr:hypothetical protein [Verrucomicrobiota bacterium]
MLHTPPLQATDGHHAHLRGGLWTSKVAEGGSISSWHGLHYRSDKRVIPYWKLEGQETQGSP